MFLFLGLRGLLAESVPCTFYEAILQNRNNFGALMFSVSRDPVSDDAHTYNWFTVPRGDFDALERYICAAHWSGVLWQPAVRNKKNYYVAQMCVLDFDGSKTLAEAHEIFAPFKHLIGATAHHQIEKPSKTPGSPSRPACDRFRVALWFSAPIFSREVYEFNMKKIIERFGADKDGKGAHMKWKPCRTILARKDEGASVLVETNIPEEETDEYWTKIKKAQLAKLKKDGKVIALPKQVIDTLTGKVLPGGRNNALYRTCCDLFDLGYKLHEVRKLVEKLPWYYEASGEDALQSAARKTGMVEV